MRADTYEYPFSFTFPSHCDSRCGQSQFNNNDGMLWKGPGIDTSTAQLLPPSCEDSDTFDNNHCHVYYHLTACVPRTFSDWEDKVNLNFNPFRTELSPAPVLTTSKDREIKHRNYKVEVGGGPRPLSKRELAIHGFHRSHDMKTISFTIEAEAPTNIVLGEDYPLILTLVSPDDITSMDPSTIPAFKLKSYHLRLRAQTDIRVPGAFSDHNDTWTSHISLSTVNLKEAIDLQLNESKRISKAFPESKSYAPPSFQSLAAKRSYQLELKAKIECLGGEEEFKVIWPRCTIISGMVEGGDEMERAIEESLREAHMGVQSLEIEREGGEGGGDLPAYGEHVGSYTVKQPEVLPQYEGSSEVGGMSVKA